MGGVWSAAFSSSLVTIYDLQERAAIAPLRQAGPAVVQLLSTKDGRWAAAVETNLVRFLDLSTDAGSKLELPRSNDVATTAISPGALLLALASTNRTLEVWNIEKKQPQFPKIEFPDDIKHLRFSQDEGYLLIVSREGAAILDCQAVQPGSRLIHISTKPAPDPQWGAVPQFDGEFSPDGRAAVIAWGDGFGYLVDARSGDEQYRFPHKGPVWRAHFSPEGERVVTASFDGTARIWDVKKGSALTKPLEHSDAVFDARFSPDGDRVVTVSLDGSSRVWDSHTGRLLAQTRNYSGGIIGCEISPDGKLFGTYSDRRVVQFWDMETGQAVSDQIPAALANSGLRSEIRFQPDNLGTLVMTSAGYRRYALPQPPLPAPDWLSELARLLAGFGDEEHPASGLLKLRARLEQQPGDDFYAEWARWFFANPESRATKKVPFS